MKNVALITGASRGIGEALAHLHAERGGDLVLVARSEEQLNSLAIELQARYKVKTLVIAADLSQAKSAEKIYNQTQNIQISYLINNAGFGIYHDFASQDADEIEAMIALNIAALTRLTRLYVSQMKKQGGGKVLNISSVASFLPGPFMAVYYASKAYVTSFSLALAKELDKSSISVTALCPGAVDTDFAVIGGVKDAYPWLYMSKSADYTAKIGYEAMLKGQLIAFNDKRIEILIKYFMPFLPTKILLSLSELIIAKPRPA